MFLLINKEKKITSHDVVDKLRKITNIKKIGHAGTLDPNATGLLIVGVGRESTKKLGKLTKNTIKTYVAEIILGEERETDDVEGKKRDISFENIKPTKPEVSSILKTFIGINSQVPPFYSAIKIKGKKAYEFARKGKEIQLKPRKVVIDSIKLVSYKYPKVTLETDVSSGTYIRSLARDIGKKLKTGAYLNDLKRTKIGKYSIENAVDLKLLTSDNWKNFGFEL